MFDPIPMPDLTTLPAACAAEGIDLKSEETAITTVPQLVGAFEVLCDHITQQPTLTPDVLDTVRLALMAQVDGYVEHMAASIRNGGPGLAAYFAAELWQIDRARRALGIED